MIPARSFPSRKLARRGLGKGKPPTPGPRDFQPGMKLNRAWLVKHVWVDVRAMHRGVAAGRPTGAPLQKIRVRDLADHEFVRLNIRSLHLHMALEAEIIVPFGKKLPVDRSVGIVAGDATVAQRFVLKNERTALFAMTLRAALVEPRHREPARRLHNVVTVGIMALDAVHDSFNDGMMLREFELGMDVQMALKARAGIFARIYDEPAATADADMLAGRAL